MDFASGYVQRSLHLLPKQGVREPWRLRQNYLRDAADDPPRRHRGRRAAVLPGRRTRVVLPGVRPRREPARPDPGAAVRRGGVQLGAHRAGRRLRRDERADGGAGRAAAGLPGIESARDADGFGITVSYWADEAAAAAWKQVAEHLVAQRRGREAWYADYRVRVAVVQRDYGP